MRIESTLTNRARQILKVIYYDIENERELGDKKAKGVHAYCFYQDKLVLVYADNKGYWTPPGGGIEPGEDIKEAIRREIKEETNMRATKMRLIGYQDVHEPRGINTQIRAVCLVEPEGPFVADPDGDVTKIELVDPKDYKNYFDWDQIGDHLMTRALEIKKILDSEINFVK